MNTVNACQISILLLVKVVPEDEGQVSKEGDKVGVYSRVLQLDDFLVFLKGTLNKL